MTNKNKDLGDNDNKICNCDESKGIGVFRSEFLYMDRPDFPSEEEEFQVCKKVVESFEDNIELILKEVRYDKKNI